MNKTLQHTVSKVKFTIYGHGRGWCMVPSHFRQSGTVTAIRYALHVLCKQGMIRRLAKGLYDYPFQDDVFGVLPPDINKVAKTIADKNKVRIQPSGAYAANLIGLSEQVPARIVFVTDGPSKKIKISNKEIIFKKAAPKSMILAGTEAGLVVNALRHIGRKKITSKMEQVLKQHLNKFDERQINKIHQYAPVWISALIRELLGENV